jgi:hypothetical protein
MKTLALALLLFSTAVTSAEPANRITVDTTDWPPGRAQVFTLDGTVNVTVFRLNETRTITIQRLGLKNTYTIAPVDGELQVTSADTNDGLLLSPHRVVVDGVTLEKNPVKLPPSIQIPGEGKPRYYICPKDEVMLRVPHDKHAGEFTCPVDGTKMKPAVGRESRYFLLH